MVGGYVIWYARNTEVFEQIDYVPHGTLKINFDGSLKNGIGGTGFLSGIMMVVFSM